MAFSKNILIAFFAVLALINFAAAEVHSEDSRILKMGKGGSSSKKMKSSKKGTDAPTAAPTITAAPTFSAFPSAEPSASNYPSVSPTVGKSKKGKSSKSR